MRPLTLLVTVLATGIATAAPQLTNDGSCDCYKTNATASNYFARHKFFDFRSLQQFIKTPSLEKLDTVAKNANAPPTSSYFTSTQWSDYWTIQTWDRAPPDPNSADANISDATVHIVNSPNNIFIERDEDDASQNGSPFNPWWWNPWNQPGQQQIKTHLTMRTTRHREGFQSASEIESKSKGYQFMSVRMHARTRGSPGAVTAMFTYRPPPEESQPEKVQEADLEILTKDPADKVQYTNQPGEHLGGAADSTKNASMPQGRKWSDWATYRMDWTPTSTTWFVNGIESGRISVQVPRDGAQLLFNVWSNGGSWSGVMGKGHKAEMQIRWIDMVFNSTDVVEQGVYSQPKEGGCRRMCSIDETTQIGRPVVISHGGGGGGDDGEFKVLVLTD